MTADRDRNAAGRPQSARPRDATGRPLPRDAVGTPGWDGVVPDPDRAAAVAQALIDDGRPFVAHEVLEAVWKASSPQERDFWRGLAQVAVALTHLQRGNPAGAAALMTRAAAQLRPYGPAVLHGVRPDAVATAAEQFATELQAGAARTAVRLLPAADAG